MVDAHDRRPQDSGDDGDPGPIQTVRGDNDQGIEVVEYKKRMAVAIYCQFEGEGVNLIDQYDDTDALSTLVDLLAKVRAELMEGDTSFLNAVAEFYNALDEDEKSSEDDEEPSSMSIDDMSKTDLQQECERRGITYRKSWTKAQLQEALAASRASRTRARPRKGGRPKLSQAAQTIVGQLENQ